MCVLISIYNGRLSLKCECWLNISGWMVEIRLSSVNPILSSWSQTDVTNSFIFYDSCSQTQRHHRKITCHEIRRSLSQQWLLCLSAGGGREEIQIDWRDVREPSPVDCWQLMPTISSYSNQHQLPAGQQWVSFSWRWRRILVAKTAGRCYCLRSCEGTVKEDDVITRVK